MHKFNRDYALIGADGTLLAQSDSAKVLENLRAQLLQDNIVSEVFATFDELPDADARAAFEIDHARDYRKHEK